MDHVVDIPRIVAFLAERYPRAFFVKGKQRRPLKVGVYRDLVADLNGEIGPKELSLVLHYYVNELGYLKATRRGRPRVDLSGKIAGRVTEEEEVHAKTQFVTVARNKMINLIRSGGGSR